jgi:hypothetical protein
MSDPEKIHIYHLKYRDYDPQTPELMIISFLAGRKYQKLLYIVLMKDN